MNPPPPPDDPAAPPPPDSEAEVAEVPASDGASAVSAAEAQQAYEDYMNSYHSGVDYFKAWRFALRDRVLCNLGAQHGWVPGSVQAIDEPNPEEPTATLPYVVKLDAPLDRLVTVPFDANSTCRPEACFAIEEAELSHRCMGHNRTARPTLRFEQGDRVAVLAEVTYDESAAGGGPPPRTPPPYPLPTPPTHPSYPPLLI